MDSRQSAAESQFGNAINAVEREQQVPQSPSPLPSITTGSSSKRKQSRPKSLLVHHVVEARDPPPKAPKLAEGTGVETPRVVNTPLAQQNGSRSPVDNDDVVV